MAAAKGGRPVCDPDLRLYCSCVRREYRDFYDGVRRQRQVCSVQFAASRLFADCLLLYDGVRRRRQVCCVQFAESRLLSDCRYAVMATGTRSNVTPVVLREDTRPPAYGDKHFEGASRTFYIKYTEYTKRVAHANAGGAIQREVVSIAELIPSNVQIFFARVYHESRTITPTQLEVAVESLSLIHI